MTRHDRLQMEQMLEEGYSPSYFNLNPRDKADGGTGGLPTRITDGALNLKVNQASDAEVKIACCLERIADALERIAPYFEERIIDATYK